MILKCVELFDFKSIKHEYIDINCNQLCFVGINESGKSSLLEAISYLNVDIDLTSGLLNKSAASYPKGFPLISGVFEINNIDNADLIQLISKEIDATRALSTYDRLFIQLKRWGNGFDNIALEISDNIRSDESKFKMDILESLKNKNRKIEFLDVFFSEHYPIIELFTQEDLLLEPATLDDLKGTNRNFETLRRLLYLGGCIDLDTLDLSDPLFFATFIKRIETKINLIVKSHYRQDESIHLHIVSVVDKIVVIVNDGTQQTFSLNERSPGFQYYIAFLINKLFYNLYYHNRSIVFLLDEPGNNLHPKGAKDLLRTFDEISKKSLLFYTTHNPFLTIRNNINSLVFVNKSFELGTKIIRKPWMKKYQVVRKELGILLNDSFLIGDVNLLVEGITEKMALHHVFQFERFSHLEWVNIYNVDGVTNMTQTLNFLGKNNLDLSGVLLFDSDREGNDERKKATFKKLIVDAKWDLVEINNLFNDDGNNRTFEDIFPQDLYVKAFNYYCHTLKPIKIFANEYVDFVIPEGGVPTPIISILSNHFYSFIDDVRRSKESISKQEVMTYLLGSIADESNGGLDNLFELAQIIDNKVKEITKHAN